MTARKKKKRMNNIPPRPDIEAIDKNIAACDAAYNSLLEQKRIAKLIGFRTPNDNR